MTRSHKTLTTLTALIALAGTPTALLAQSGPTHNPAEVQSGNFVVDSDHTQVGFSVLHMGFSNFTGRFSDVTGTLSLSSSDPTASKLSITLPTKSVSTPVEKLNGELRDDKWLDSGKFPTATFTSTKVTLTAPDSATIAGELTLHGVTKPITLTAHLVGAGTNPLSQKYTVGFEATGVIKRSEFGVSTYVPLIGDEVKLTINGAFEKQ